MGVDRRVHGAGPGLHLGHELDQPADVVSSRETLAVHQALRVEVVVWQQESVGRDQIDTRTLGHRESSARRMRAKVLLPTATLPAMPMT